VSWTPSPNPGGNNRKLARNAAKDWLRAQRIPGLETVHASQSGPDGIVWEDSVLSSGRFHAQLVISIPADSEDRLAYAGSNDPGGKMLHLDMEFELHHIGGEAGEWEASEDDYDRIVEAIKDALRGAGRDFGRPDVVLQVGEYPRVGGIRTEHEAPVDVSGACFRQGRILFTYSQYLPSPADQEAP
jgi:hypothetical protein